MSTRKKWQIFAGLVLIVLGLDQATKLYIHTTFALHESYPVIADLFALTYVRNSGAAFGLLARQSQTFLRLFFPPRQGVGPSQRGENGWFGVELRGFLILSDRFHELAFVLADLPEKPVRKIERRVHLDCFAQLLHCFIIPARHR